MPLYAPSAMLAPKLPRLARLVSQSIAALARPYFFIKVNKKLEDKASAAILSTNAERSAVGASSVAKLLVAAQSPVK